MAALAKPGSLLWKLARHIREIIAIWNDNLRRYKSKSLKWIRLFQNPIDIMNFSTEDVIVATKWADFLLLLMLSSF